jgi:hypothetical protein
MVTPRWHDDTLMKTQWCDGENTMVRTWNNDCTIMKQRLYDNKTTKTRWWKRDETVKKDHVTMVKIRWYDMTKLRWHDDENAILFSLSCHSIFVISPSCHRVLIIVPSQLHLFTIVRDKNVTYVQTEHGNRLILNDTISCLASCLIGMSQLAWFWVGPIFHNNGITRIILGSYACCKCLFNGEPEAAILGKWRFLYIYF